MVRWIAKQTQVFFAPGFQATGGDFNSAESGGADPGYYFGGMRGLHGVAPESVTTTHYIISGGFTRDFRSDAEMTAALSRLIEAAIFEDKEALEAIEVLISDSDDVAEISAKSDVGAFGGRARVKSNDNSERREPVFVDNSDPD